MTPAAVQQGGLGLADREVVRLKDGDTATLRFDAFLGKEFTGKVQEVSRAADPRMGALPRRYRRSAQDTSSVAWTGRSEFVRYRMASRCTYIPLTAPGGGDQRNMLVYLLPKGASQVKAQRVPIAFIAGDRAALAQHCLAGNAVVTEGSTYLRDGEKVSVVADETASK